MGGFFGFVVVWFFFLFICATVMSELEEIFYMTNRQVFCSEVERKLGLHS